MDGALSPAPPSQALRRPLRVRLATPRGFCAGVDRAIRTVELALEQHGAPVYVRHEIVHNRHVVEALRAKGAVFVETLDAAPDGRPVVFSAHGAPRCEHDKARARNLAAFDATCPLVTKVHVEAQRHHAEGREVVLVGHAGHVEVVGTMGQLPPGAVTLVETVADALAFQPRDPARLAITTQTTLSVDDTAEIVDALRARFPLMAAPHREDICYATTNRQEAVKRLAQSCALVLVLGSATSSNSVRLVETARRAGAAAQLIEDAWLLDWAWLEGVDAVGVTAGASAPEHLVQGLLDRLAERFDLCVEDQAGVVEGVTFRLPRGLERAV